MNILLDTHILLWALASPKKLPKAAVAAIHQAHELYFSPVNLWEVGIKSAIYSEYGISGVEEIHAACLKANLQEMPINSVDMMKATQLPAIHRDTFDRILIAQSHNRCCHLITVDSKIAQYQMPYLLIV